VIAVGITMSRVVVSIGAPQAKKALDDRYQAAVGTIN
jgi:hypothetical protein